MSEPLFSLTADQLAERARSIMGDHNERVAAIAELQTRANRHDNVDKELGRAVDREEVALARAEAVKKERDEAQIERDGWKLEHHVERDVRVAAEARLAETQEALEAARNVTAYSVLQHDGHFRVDADCMAALSAALTTHPTANE